MVWRCLLRGSQTEPPRRLIFQPRLLKGKPQSFRKGFGPDFPVGFEVRTILRTSWNTGYHSSAARKASIWVWPGSEPMFLWPDFCDWVDREQPCSSKQSRCYLVSCGASKVQATWGRCCAASADATCRASSRPGSPGRGSCHVPIEHPKNLNMCVHTEKWNVYCNENGGGCFSFVMPGIIVKSDQVVM